MTIVPAGGIASIPMNYTVYRAGRFECQFELFLEGDGIQTTSVTCKGVGLASEGSTHDKPSS